MSVRVVLLVDYLEPLLASLPESEVPALLSRLLNRASREASPYANADSLRLHAFGLNSGMSVPAAALAAMDHDGFDPDAHYLRLDPVTFRADMTRVFLLDTGWADYSDAEKDQWMACAGRALADAPCQVFGEDATGVILRLDQPLTFEFSTLEQARGADVGEFIPQGSNAAAWRKALSELQVELHNHSVSQERRSQGKAERNAGWFWGGGALPGPASTLDFRQVCSDQPLSRALARLNGCELGESFEQPVATFIDLDQSSSDAGIEVVKLERWLSKLIPAAETGKIALEVHDGAGHCYRHGRWQRFLFWR